MTNYDPSLLANAIQTDTGEHEVPATWVAAHRDAFRLLDIREPHELEGPLGHVEGVPNVPLLTLLSQASSLDADEPLVLLCRSGRRSARAARELRQHGVKTVASVEGGMIAWNVDVLGNEGVPHDEANARAQTLSEAIFHSNGLPEVSAAWVAKHFGSFRFVDVRQPAELLANGAVPQAENIPLEAFMAQANDLDRDAPLVVMCQSGGRSGRVVRALQGAGFTHAASMEGGILGWRASGLPYR